MRKAVVWLVLGAFGLAGLSGCMAPALLPLLNVASFAAGGFDIYKGVQLTTGGSAEMRFKEPKGAPKISEGDKKFLSSINRPAVYPGTTDQVALAEALAKNKEYDVIGPYSVRKAMSESDKFLKLEEMTEEERAAYAVRLCNTLKADGLLVLLTSEGATKMHNWSLDRPEIAVDFKIELISPSRKKIVWSRDGELVLKFGSNKPAEKEVADFMASAIISKFLEDIGKKQPNGNGKNEKSSTAVTTLGEEIPQSAVQGVQFPETKSSGGLAEAAEIPANARLVVLKNCNIRKGPSTATEIVATVPAGTQMEKIAENGDWYNVRFNNGQTGFIFKSLVK